MYDWEEPEPMPERVESFGPSPLTPIVSKLVRIRYPDLFSLGAGCVVDDFCYFAGIIQIGRWSHVASGVTIGGGGRKRRFRLGDWSGVAAGCRIFMGSSHYVRDPITCQVAGENEILGDVIFEDHTGIGANSVVMPDQHVLEGVAIGALSFVPSRFPFEPWTVYGGNPIRAIRVRDRVSVLKQARYVAR